MGEEDVIFVMTIYDNNVLFVVHGERNLYLTFAYPHYVSVVSPVSEGNGVQQ